MKCLSLKQPWADMIVTPHPSKRGACLKDIENRKWRIGRKLAALMPFDCLIQASLTIDLDGWPELREQARLARFEIPDAKLMTVGAIVGQVTIWNQVQHSESPWFVGPWGFELINPIKFANPFPFKGQLGFFEIDDEIADQIFYEGVRMSESQSEYVANRTSQAVPRPDECNSLSSGRLSDGFAYEYFWSVPPAIPKFYPPLY